jgi:hypothetical protein
METGLQALMGYIYGLRMDLIGQFDGVGLHRAFDYFYVGPVLD